MNKKMIYIGIVGFFLGVLFYFFNHIISNSEISSINPTIEELFRNINYLILLIYGVIGLMTVIILSIIKNLIKWFSKCVSLIKVANVDKTNTSKILVDLSSGNA